MKFNLAAVFFVHYAYAHSWVERIYTLVDDMVIGNPGFPRGNGTYDPVFSHEAKFIVLRTAAFKDADMVYRLPPSERIPNAILPSDLACKETQRTSNQTFGSPELTVRPRSKLLLMYQENGHVTRIQENDAHPGSGLVSVFGRVNSSPTDTLQGLFDTADDGSSVRLLAKRSFDDGMCYESNDTPIAKERKLAATHRPHLEVEGPNVWCGLEVALPSDTDTSDTYTLYWVWEFNGSGFVEKYTTCIDVTVLHNG